VEDADLWIAYCAFHLGDYKKAYDVCEISFIIYVHSMSYCFLKVVEVAGVSLLAPAGETLEVTNSHTN